MKLDSILTLHYILANHQKICLVLRYLQNGYHIETMNEGNKESFYITSIISRKKIVAQKFLAFSSRLYHTTIKPIESYAVMNQKFDDPKIFTLWHNRLGHPGSSMMR